MHALALVDSLIFEAVNNSRCRRLVAVGCWRRRQYSRALHHKLGVAARFAGRVDGDALVSVAVVGVGLDNQQRVNTFLLQGLVVDVGRDFLAILKTNFTFYLLFCACNLRSIQVAQVA